MFLFPWPQPFIDLQHPNGQFTYTSGEGLSTSAFLPFRGGLLQAQGQYPGEMKFSYSRKVNWKFLLIIWLLSKFYCGLYCLGKNLQVKLIFEVKYVPKDCIFKQNKWGTRITPTVQWPDRSFTLGLDQVLSWKKSGLMVRPSVQVRWSPCLS